MKNYDDIINLPYHRSTKYPRMPIIDRAAQFSPFAALTGYEEAIKETERPVDERIQLSEDAIVKLDEQLQLVAGKADKQPPVEITYFVPDERKTGGKYVTVRGNIKKIDQLKKIIVLQGEKIIPINEIIDIIIIE